MSKSVKSLEDLGRERLSPNFFMRDFLYSEIAQVEGLQNVPVDSDLAVRAGRKLCENVLEPIQKKLGRISVRSGYRSPQVNKIGNEKKYSCASNEKNRARHIWDLSDEAGNYGATACVVVNSFVEFYNETRDWTVLAWWLHDHITEYRDIMFFPKLAAFNISWYSGPSAQRMITSQVVNPHTGKKGVLTKQGMDNYGGTHECLYRDWILSMKS